ncbi:MAG: hypothetical protein QF848_16125, partial [Planctomycetota bacterium]|nr:hypothetical protein [Planctomycetota bacterium]
TFITGSTTACLELQLLHRSGDSEAATTYFDDVHVEQTSLSLPEVIEHITQNYKPRDGSESQTPWRLRVELMGEVRDAVLIPPPASLAIPAAIPGAASRPHLRFQYSMTPEAQRAEGDGAYIDVSFEDGAGVKTSLGRVSVDPRNERDHRFWLKANLDLGAVAGQEGRIVFTSSDMDDEPDLLDTVLVATPRIEPAEQAP